MPGPGACPRRLGEKVWDASLRTESRYYFAADCRSGDEREYCTTRANRDREEIPSCREFAPAAGWCAGTLAIACRRQRFAAVWNNRPRDWRGWRADANENTPRNKVQEKLTEWRTTLPAGPEVGVCAEWEAGFRLTGNGKPVMDGVSG